MKVFTICAILASAVATVQAGCYNPSSPWWGNQNDINAANEFVDSICNSGGVSGYFSQGETKYRCHQRGARHMFQFWVQWKGQGGLTLNDDDCKKRLKDEINGCAYGGESTIADWYFRSDPNTGAC